jgi:hypothetical protein
VLTLGYAFFLDAAFGRRCPGYRVADRDPRRARSLRLRDTEEDSAELAQRLSLSAQPVDFRPHRRRQRRVRCVSAKSAEFMLEVLLGLRRDITNSSFPLEFDDEMPGCVHPVTIGQSAAVEEGILDKRAIPLRGSGPFWLRDSAPGGCRDRSDGFCRPLQEAGVRRHQIAQHGLGPLLRRNALQILERSPEQPTLLAPLPRYAAFLARPAFFFAGPAFRANPAFLAGPAFFAGPAFLANLAFLAGPAFLAGTAFFFAGPDLLTGLAFFFAGPAFFFARLAAPLALRIRVLLDRRNLKSQQTAYD